MHANRRAAILGVTGFIGSGLPELLAKRGVAVTGVSRSAGKQDADVIDRWQKPDELDLAGHEMVINLAGAPIDRRWTKRAKEQFRDSRVGVTATVVDAIRKLPETGRPKVLVNGSAVGIYGDRGDEILREDAARGEGFLAQLCADWERAALEAEALGVRVVLLRTGVALGEGGAAWKKLRTVIGLGLGGKLGSGCQWMPWIHVEDLRCAIVHAAMSDALEGPLNGSAPEPERNAELTRKMARALHRPALVPAPAFALRIALGEFAGALLASQRAVPAALEHSGFVFRHRTLDSALAELVERSTDRRSQE